MLHPMSWYPMEPADASIFETAPYVYSYPVDLPVSAERLWESLVSDESMAAWGLGVRRLTWLTPRPFSVETRREVVLPLGSMTVREQFFRWDEGKGFSFYVYEANRKLLRRFAEDYVVESTPDGSRFTWTIAYEPLPRTSLLLRASAPMNRRAYGLVPRAAKRYFAEHP
jgi:Polyketide cyclase / dehydrase and lipid transport